MVICISGASGFVGAHLIPVLQKLQHTVRIFTRNKKNKFPGVENHFGNVSDNRALKKFLSGADIIINLIGTFPPPFEDQFRANAEIPYRIFSEAGRLGIPRVIHVSAAAIYGDLPAKNNPSENADPQPTTTYGLSKLLGEQMLRYCAKRYKQRAIILRPTNIYGSDATAGVIHSMRESYLRSREIYITGDGTQERDFIHVDDVVSAIVTLLEDPKAVGTYNLASGEMYTIAEIADMFKRKSKTPVSVVFLPQAHGFVKSLRADTSKLTREYAWRPKHRVSATITRAVMHR